ncbi:MAG: hypothetical protein DI601_00290 [Azospirillum brasilense]|nr:MAG: hypothetical protein DI601_00290 [Azospirillum brasilense]
MATYARMTAAGSVAEVIPLPDGTDLEEVFHPDLARQLVACPEGTLIGWTRDADGQWREPVPAPKAAVRVIPRSDFLSRLTGDERRAIAAAAAEDMDVSLQQARLSTWRIVDLDSSAVREVVDSWVAAKALSSARATTILK